MLLSGRRSACLLAFFFFCFSLLGVGDACFSTGCGGMTLCLPALPIPVINWVYPNQQGCCCQPSCMTPSCARQCSFIMRRRHRAKAAKSLKIDDREFLFQDAIVVRDPNAEFRACCAQNNLPNVCLDKCDYSTYTRQALQAMFLRMDSCPTQSAAVIHYCAARGHDHTRCCARRGVLSEFDQKCQVFCDQRPGKVTQLDLGHLQCFQRFDSIRQCFWEGAQAETSVKRRLADFYRTH